MPASKPVTFKGYKMTMVVFRLLGICPLSDDASERGHVNKISTPSMKRKRAGFKWAANSVCNSHSLHILLFILFF